MQKTQHLLRELRTPENLTTNQIKNKIKKLALNYGYSQEEITKVQNSFILSCAQIQEKRNFNNY